MHQKLILFTTEFPYGSGETFLETEIKYLSKGFDEVIIFSASQSDVQTRALPDNCIPERIDLEMTEVRKIRSISEIFSPLFREELKIIQKIYGMKSSTSIISTMLISLHRAKKVQAKVLNFVQQDASNSDLYFYSYWCDDTALGLALASLIVPRIRTFSRMHRWDIYFDQSTVGYLPYRHFIAKHLKAIYSISEDGIRYAREVWRIDTNNIHLSRLGIEAQEPLKERKNGVFTIVSCSNMIPVKRVHLIAEAIKELDGKFPLRWIHIGEGPERKRVEKIISSVGASTKVELVGRLTNPEVFELYRKVVPDLFVNVSASEGVPVSIMEAMSFGMPVLATDAGGNKEIVNEENGKLLANAITALELVDELWRFYSKLILGEKNFKKGALQTWKSNYNAEINYTSFIKLICALEQDN